MAWGDNRKGQSTVPTELGQVVSVAAGERHSLALKSDGTVVAWGANDRGQSTVPAGLSNVVAIAAGWWHSLALKADGTVVGWGSNGVGESTVPAGLSGVVAIAAGGLSSMALRRAEPMLTMQRIDRETLAIKWPSPSTGWVLQGNARLGTTNWFDVPPTVDDGTYVSVTIKPSLGDRFYRLFKP